MSIHTEIKKVTISTLRKMKASGEKIAMLTAYDYTFAKIVDAAKIDVILVGDSCGNVMAGYETTVPVTLDHMIYHAASVVRGAHRSMVIADLPFGSYQGNLDKALESSIRMMKETGVQALKLEGGAEIAETIRVLVQSGIPVMGHLGLTPQHINQFGSYAVRAKEASEVEKLKRDISALLDAGIFGLVLEKIPANVAAEVTASISIPVIGIGAGSQCDGQVLVLQDMLGMYNEFKPKFVRKFADLDTVIQSAVSDYIHSVKDISFPNNEESY